MINTIKTELNTLITALDSIQEVNNYDKDGSDNYPCVNLMCAGNSNEFWSVAQNQRGYNFTIRVVMPLNGLPLSVGFNKSKEVAESIIGDVIDDIVDMLDTKLELTTVGTNFMKAAPSSWGYQQLGEGWTRTADINLQVIIIKTN